MKKSRSSQAGLNGQDAGQCSMREQSSQQPGLLAPSPGPAWSIAGPSKEGIFDPLHHSSEQRTTRIAGRAVSIRRWSRTWKTPTIKKNPKRDCVRAWGLGRALRVRTTCARPQTGKAPKKQ